MRLALLSLVLASGCHSIGPGTVARDRIDYGTSITDSWKRQTLLNIVKLRYADAPLFLDVGQIVAGYTLEVGASAGATFVSGPDSASVGASGKFTDRPTVTYTPLTGPEFLSPVRDPHEGILLHGVYHRPRGWGVDASVMWGEYFFMELVERLLGSICARFGIQGRRMSPMALEALAQYDWRRNNVRELRNVVERMVIASDSAVIGAEHVPPEIRGVTVAPRPAGGTLVEQRAEAERQIVVAALERHEWHVTRTAQALGLADHASLLKIMRRHGIKRAGD